MAQNVRSINIIIVLYDNMWPSGWYARMKITSPLSDTRVLIFNFYHSQAADLHPYFLKVRDLAIFRHTVKSSLTFVRLTRLNNHQNAERLQSTRQCVAAHQGKCYLFTRTICAVLQNNTMFAAISIIEFTLGVCWEKRDLCLSTSNHPLAIRCKNPCALVGD